MDKLIALLQAAAPFVIAVTGLLVVVQQWRMAKNIQKIEKQGNSAQTALLKLTADKNLGEGRAQESAAQSKGETTVGDPLTPPS